MVLTKKNYVSSFLEKVYLRIHENMHDISLKIVYERI